MAQKIVQIDAFSSKPFAGNPAAVCLMEEAAGERWMQQVAAEMNLAETAFLYPHEAGYNLKWFTPVCEVELCGHATLASTYLLFTDGLVAPDQTISFFTLSGELKARLVDGWIELDFPATPVSKVEPPDGLIEALGCHKVRFVGQAGADLLVEHRSETKVRALDPDFTRLASIDSRGIMVTSESDGQPYQFVSRFFAPAYGINEDPVTGSAHCALATYWANKLDRTEFTAYQASPRGGEVRVKLEGDRVKLSGRANITMRAELVEGEVS